MKILGHFFENNKNWAAAIKKADPDFFSKLANQQRPESLWIGCAETSIASR